MVSNNNDNRNTVSLVAIIIQAAEHIASPRLSKHLQISNEKAVHEAIELVSEVSRQLREGESEWYDALQRADNTVDQLKTTEKLLRAELKLANDRIAVFENRVEEEEKPGPMINIEGRVFATFTTSSEFIITDPMSSLMGSGKSFRAALLALYDEIIDLHDVYGSVERFYSWDTEFGDLVRWIKKICPTINIPQIPDPFNDEDIALFVAKLMEGKNG